ncbi:hypothetical protein HYR99_36825 [Candidatus Poribacteria bacterium]|nr:hypothetical protein [Candidatus Poribacteria bacterium]
MAISEHKPQAKRQSVRLNVQLPVELKEALDQQAAKLNTTTPKLARDFLRRGLGILKQKELDGQLIAGYQYLAQENQRLLEEFRHVDQESWEWDDANDA